MHGHNERFGLNGQDEFGNMDAGKPHNRPAVTHEVTASLGHLLTNFSG